MAELKPIEYPDYLNRHTLTDQELLNLTESQKALAKDWNVINRKVDWIINEQVELHNILVEHDKLLEIWKKVLWLIGLSITATGIVLSLLRVLR